MNMHTYTERKDLAVVAHVCSPSTLGVDRKIRSGRCEDSLRYMKPCFRHIFRQ